MRTSIATVSLGGTLREKLAAIAEAGFEGVEIFEADILAHDGPPREVGAMVRDLGLEIVAFQPFRDFEGMPEPQRARNMERARRKFELMTELGTQNILVCSNCSPRSLGGIDRAAEDLRELAGIAEGFGVTIGFEALAWGRHVSDYRDAWEIVRRADHPRLGIILDSWHILSRGHPVDAIRAIPADRITFVQLADAPRLDMDLLQWSRHFRNFPGQGDLPIARFMEALDATGYDGWLSHEIFNDRFRMASPRRIAEDGERSLIWLTEARRNLPPRVKPERVEWVEFAVDEEGAQKLGALFRTLGFAHVGRHRSKQVQRWAQGAINLVLNTDAEGFANSHHVVHGPSVVALGLRVDDAARALDRAEALRMRTFRQPVGPGELEIPAIRGLGGALNYFVDGQSDLARVWEIEFETLAPVPPGPLTGIDHIAQSMPPEEMLSWRLYYLSLFDFETTPQVDVVDPAGVVESMAVQDAGRAVRICLNSSQSTRTMAARFMSEYFGAGVQHLAFATADIFAAVAAFEAAGVALLPIPENYYDDLEARFDLDPDLADRLRRHNVLYDEDESGRYFQVYTGVFAERFFFEVVQREGYAGFGAPNAPIRLAAQTRLAAHFAMPRS
ncbi:sugar phosphate isomerase/epimerase and 4-hydroxyphenylpyruvate domain-containing protein [Paroceanicella profunda]|uniref:3-dehydroshikimate dehydratase n=1 Tax=Paroceanicella profunda TaxID=2579971 RepID=A0A5B8FUK8_9RHOB|nr:sugar phosphate isomerase/epimerase and 4-hydroxyphenylpyruvate domain-containing protein [Paroceanicella profunda]QDL92426.1 sugar phosphate isomerase/epimerase and 4-hydroxyphenylpyruvate domain-containing protein [Paroceanicella profunda]